MLRETLADTRATVRSYDTKAQIVGVGYLFALGAIGRFDEQIPTAMDITTATVVVFWAMIMLPIILFGSVLYPTRKSAPLLSEQAESKPRRVLYVNPDEFKTVAALKTAVIGSNALDETAFELLKASKLRELKRKRFIRGLIAAGVAFTLIFASQFFQSV